MGLLMDEKEFGMLEEKQQKKYLFKENVRLNELKQELEADRELIDIQKGMLHRQQKKNQLLQKQLENQKIFLTRSGRYLSARQDSLHLIKKSLTGKSLCIVTRFIVRQEEACLMRKMSRYFSVE